MCITALVDIFGGSTCDTSSFFQYPSGGWFKGYVWSGNTYCLLPVWVDEVLDNFTPLPPISTKMWICFYIYILILVLHVCILG